MRRPSILFNLFGAVGLIGLLSGCGSGGGDGAATGTGGATSGSAAASGTITGFGSVYVNGKKFETNGASLMVDGQAVPCTVSAASKCGLKEGMTVTVTGSFSGDQRFAGTVSQSDAVEGLVQSIAPDGLSLVVMGQTVFVDSTTLIDDSNGLNGNIGNLVVGNFVEVNGHVRPNGVIQATFIERKVAGITPEVRGFVTGHNAITGTFQIGGLNVVYNGITIIGDMPTPSGSNWNGRFVEVKGTFISATTTLTASKVEPENQGIGNNMDEFEVEGFVTRVDAPGDFFIGTTHVQTTGSTLFRGGTIDEIIVGAKLSAEGRLANGILTAKHVKFHAAVKLEGNIATINGNAFTIAGLPGVTVTVNSQTEGGNTLNNLLGSHVRVRGRLGSSNSVIATRIEDRGQADSDVDLQGPVQSVVGQDLTILEVVVDTSTISNDNFEGLNDQIIGRAAFFNAVKEGTLVKMQGRLSGSTVTWREAELED
ncbi:MAG: hypothetical protein HOP32_12545 [Nitrospira sp.]|nr:hypothetical protein [Nitrospira sp.]